MADSIALTCAEVALAAGREIRSVVHGMDPGERAQLRVPLLKPHGGYGARHVDAEAERVGLTALERLARDTGCAVGVIEYANLSALGRVLFGWRDPPVWLESQGGGYLVVNENVPNLIPSVPLVAGAGGISVDFAGRPLRERPLAAGRTSVLHAANEPLCRRLLEIVELAQRRAAEAA